MAAEAPLVFYLLFFFPFVKGSSHSSPHSDQTGTVDGIIHLMTSDSDLVAVNQAVLYESDLIKRDGRAGDAIKLENTTTRGLHKLIHYVQNFNRTDFDSEWDNYLRENYKVLFELLVAGNELKMESVVSMAAGIVGDMMIGKSSAEIVQMFECVQMEGEQLEDWPPELITSEEPVDIPVGTLVPIN